MRKMVCFSFVLLTLVVASSRAGEKDIKKVLNEIQNKIQGLKSYEADVEMVFLHSKGGVMEIKGKIKFLKPDKLNMEIGVKGENKTKQYMYSDGNTLWQYMPFFKLASKVDLKALKSEFPNAQELVSNQSNINTPVSEIEKADIKYLGEEELEGEKVYVFEGKITPEKKQELDMPVDIAKVKVWVSQKDGLQRKSEFYSSKGEVVFYQTFKNVKVNIPIPKSDFEFQTPEGVNVLDSTPQARETLKKKQAQLQQKEE